MPRRYIPDRGDLIWLDFDPASGHEQNSHRPALVLSPAAFQKVTGLALVAPVTSTVRGFGFEVALGLESSISGVVLCHQIKTVDFNSRGCRFIEKAGNSVIKEALLKAGTLIK